MKFKVAMFVGLLIGSLLTGGGYVLANSSPLELQWSNTYSDCIVSSVIQAQDGGIILTGSNTTKDNQNLMLTKINNIGGVEWSKTFSEITAKNCVIQAVDSGYVVSNVLDVLLKIDFQGNIVWCKQFDSRHITGFTVAGDGSYVIIEEKFVKNENYQSLGGYDGFFVLKYDVDDNFLWENGPYMSKPTILQTNSSDNYYIANGVYLGRSFLFAKLDSAGETILSEYIGFTGYLARQLFVASLIQTQDKGLLLNGHDTSNSWLTKIASDGLWSKESNSWQERYNFLIRDVVEIENGFLAFSDTKIVGLDANGKELWSKPYVKPGMKIKDLNTNTADAVVKGVTGIVDEEGSIIVTVNYGDANTDEVDDVDGSYGCVVTKFALGSTRLVGLVILLCGIGVVVVCAFVGLLHIFKKREVNLQ